ncbi:hypothetical protein GCM10009430_20460 [Aquimarina litoralis]|uniref:Uncharacterized protein n=1 Tax=Aquimarina litoralis TaxID=584605 RepID=A0ABN1IS89_9FLAO
MKDKEDELLSVQYRIEKSGMKQQKLENRLVTISDELKRSKRNSLIFMIFFLLVIAGMSFGMYYLSKGDSKFISDESVDAKADMDRIQQMNDSLKDELTKLKSDILIYKQNLKTGSDDIENVMLSDSLNLVDSTNTKKKKYKKQHCYVKRVFRNNGVIFIEADFIEFYKGKKAVQKAKENNDAEYDIDKNGDTLYFLYKNYYVSNLNAKLRRLELNDKVRIQNLNQISKGFPLKAFEKIISDNPIMVLEMHDGIVYRITQQKLP